MSRVFLSPAYILHRRVYRETSLLIELFTPDYGRLSVIAKGVRKVRSASVGLLQPFMPLLVSWSGKSELLTLIQVEPNGHMMRLQGEGLFAGFYVNELLMALLQKWDAHPPLFVFYEQALTDFQAKPLSHKTLRLFEKQLLTEIGYAFLSKEDVTASKFLVDCFYRFIPEQGFILSEGQAHHPALFSGKSLLAIAAEDWQSHEVLQDAKRLIRLILTPLLGERKIHSRRLFVSQ